MVVDEAHAYKNAVITTKIQNVAGIGGQGSDRSMDMFLKVDYINEFSNFSNVIFATGIPISNAMSELYTMSTYLRPDIMREMGVENFDDWCASFAKVNTQMEQTAGGGYKPKKRLNEFVNLPELIEIYHTFADVKTAADLPLKIPELESGGFQTVVAPPSDFQLKYIKQLAQRSQNIKDKLVDPSVDNMLKITHEARILSLDHRLINPNLPNDPDSKLNILIENAMKIYEETADEKGVQAIFSDIGINSKRLENGDLSFSAYEFIRDELIKKGVPAQEIAFAGEADTLEKRNRLMEDLRNGTKRFVLSSTAKLGTGANFQERLAAVHHLDIPYKPSEFEQRNGRILRQGNTFKEVKILNYLTEKTLDS